MIYEIKGRKLLVEFVCGRCGRIHYEPASNFNMTSGSELESFAVPEGWTDVGDNNPMFCDTCTREYIDFLKKTSVVKEESRT